METSCHWLALLAAIPLAAAVVAATIARLRPGGAAPALVACAAPLAAIGFLLTGAGRLASGEFASFRVPWVPSLGVDLAFFGDGLSLFYTAAALVIGCLVALYSIPYFEHDRPPPARFYASLLAFMGCMVATVTADHLLSLYVFWELTGVASFLLIASNHHEKDARIGAQQALLITFGTGLCLLAGLILLGHIAGSQVLSEVVSTRAEWLSHPWLPTAVVLILLGALGKSAQVPFHFWLIGAMAAPTPVSAYLHAATMVKLGLYLCGRLDPVLQSLAWWPPALIACGWTSMIVAGWLALFARDVKAMLAYATVSAIGYLLGLYGAAIGDVGGLEALHVGNHVLYKAALFMVAGVVVHAVGSRRITDYQGLMRRLPLVAGAALLALASMSGIPGTIGFVSKEKIIAGLLEDGREGTAGTIVFILFSLGIILKVAFACRFFVAIFGGRSLLKQTVEKPSLLFQLPALILALSAVASGFAPHVLEPALNRLPVAGRGSSEHVSLHAWTGFNAEFAISSGLILAGVLLYAGLARARVFDRGIPDWADLGRAHETGLRLIERIASRSVGLMRVDRPTSHLPVVAAFLVVGVFWAALVTPAWPAADWSFSFTESWMRLFTGGMISMAAVGVVVLERWTTRVVALATAGFLVCIYFVLYRAPDLALTQILVESVTLILILFLLARFPRQAREEDRPFAGEWKRQIPRGLIAIGAGASVFFLLVFITGPATGPPAGREMLDVSVDRTHAHNVVNAILVVFRGMDTLGEAMVLFVALLGALGLLMRRRPGEDPHKPLEGRRR